MKKGVNNKKNDKMNKNPKFILIGVIICVVIIVIVGIITTISLSKKSYATGTSLYDQVALETLINGKGELYRTGTGDCYSVESPNSPAGLTCTSSQMNTLYCQVEKETLINGKGELYRTGTGDCYSVETANSPTAASVSSYKVTIYYQSSSTSGSTAISSVEVSCETSEDSCDVTIPSAVRSSVGTYNNSYAGLSTSTNTMNSDIGANATTITLTGDATYYAIYRSSVSNYYYSN